MPVTHEQVQQEFDPHYFVDYAVFSGALRNFVMTSMEAEFKNHPNDYSRRLFIVGLYQAEYSSYEDMGAMLHGFIRFQNGDHKTPLKGMLEYSPGNVVLDKLFKRYSIVVPDDLYKVLRLEKRSGPTRLDSSEGFLRCNPCGLRVIHGGARVAQATHTSARRGG